MMHARNKRVRSQWSFKLGSHRKGRACRDEFLYLLQRSLRKTVTDAVWRVMVSWRSPRRVFLAGWIIDVLAIGSWDLAAAIRVSFARYSSCFPLPSFFMQRDVHLSLWSLMQNTVNYCLLRCGLPISAVVFTLCTPRHRQIALCKILIQSIPAMYLGNTNVRSLTRAKLFYYIIRTFTSRK